MGQAAIFAGQRTKLLSAKGLLLKDGTTIDNDGVVNFIRNNSGANGTIGWTEGSYTAASRPSGSFTASSGAGAFALSTTSTTPLGTSTTSFLLTKSSGASRQGRAVETSFVLPLSYRAKVLQLNIDYIINSGSFVAGSNSTDSSLIWYCAFSTDNGSTYTVAEPSSFKLLSNSTTISDKFSASIQTPSDATNMKLIAYVAETANSAWQVETIVAVSPSNYVYGTPITDWVSYTPTYTNAPTGNSSFKWRRVGDSVQIDGTFVATGSGPAGTFTISLPSGLEVDTTKISGLYTCQGVAKLFDSGVNNYTGISSWSTSPKGIVIQLDSAGNIVQGTAFTVNDNVSVNIMLPILGWSSSVQVSDGYDGRVIAANVYRNVATANQSIPNATYTGVGFDSKNFDTTSNWVTSATGNSSYFVAPSAGYYRVSASVTFFANATGSRILAVSKTTGAGVIEHLDAKTGISGTLTLSGSRTIYANAGELIFISVYQNSGAALNLDQFWNEASIEKLAGNPVISASETVAMNYTGAPPTGTLTNNTTQNTIFGTRRTDTNGIYNTTTGIATIPVAGYYTMQFRTRINGTFSATGDSLGLIILNITTGTAYGNNVPPLLNTVLQGSVLVQAVWCNAGDQIRTQVYVAGSGTGLNYIADSPSHEFSIVKVK